MTKKRKLLSQGGVLLVAGTALALQNPQDSIIQATTCSSEEACGNLIEETKQELEKLEEETTKKEEELSAVEMDIDALMSRIEKTEGQITAISSEIKKTESKIKESEKLLVALNHDISDLKETVAIRMRMSQRLSKSNTFLSFVSEAESITDLIRSLRIVNHFAQNDSKQMDNLKALVREQQDLMRALKSEKESLAKNQAELVAQQKQLESDQKALEQKREQVKEQIQQIESEKISASEALQIAEEQKALLEKLAAEEEARRLEEERKRQEEEEKKKQEALQNQNNSSNEESTPPSSAPSDNENSSGNSSSSSQPIASDFIVPLKTGYVSCEFMCYPNHTGIDLGNRGNTNTPVVAAASGIVFRSGWHHAYGNYVMLTHNVGGRVMTTVYAHMHTAPYVSVGEVVYQGQQLGTMGNTGNSQGAHLHFEMYEGYYNYPYAVNPRKYIHFPSRW